MLQNGDNIEDHSSEGWETEEDGEEEDEEDEDDAFEEEDIDVSDEILYDKDGNIIVEEDIREGLKEIMECHMSALQKNLDVYATLARMVDNDHGEEEL